MSTLFMSEEIYMGIYNMVVNKCLLNVFKDLKWKSILSLEIRIQHIPQNRVTQYSDEE